MPNSSSLILIHVLPVVRKKGRGYDSLSLQLYGKAMETLTLKGVFIGFPNGLKWLKSTKGLVT